MAYRAPSHWFLEMGGATKDACSHCSTTPTVAPAHSLIFPAPCLDANSPDSQDPVDICKNTRVKQRAGSFSLHYPSTCVFFFFLNSLIQNVQSSATCNV